MGTIHKYKGKKVESWICHYTDAFGVRKRIVIGHCDSITYEEADQIRIEKEKEKYYKRAGLPFINKMKTRDLFQGFRSHKKRRVSISSFNVYISRINFWEDIHLKKSRIFHPLPLSEIEKAIDSVTHTFSTMNSYISTLKQIYKYALKENLMIKDSTKDIEFFPKISKQKPRFFTRAEVRRILEECNDFYKDLFRFFIYTGMRKDEVRFLQWDNINLHNRTIIIKSPKEKGEKTIPISSRVEEILRRRPRTSNYVFPNPSGGVYSVNTWLCYLQRRLEKLNIYNGKIHTFRHTFASMLAMEGVPILVIKELLGHKDIKTTQVYSHLLPEHLRNSVEKLDLEL